MGRVRLVVVLAAAMCTEMSLAGQNGAEQKPLPDAAQLKQRALEYFRTSEENLEKYSCTVRRHTDELNADGSVKRARAETAEQFFVNGVEIEHVLARDGKDLSAGSAAKEQQRVDKEVKKYSDQAAAEKLKTEDTHRAEMFLRALRFANGRRERRQGRSTIVFALTGDPTFHPHSIEERFAQALSGQIWMDEESGVPVELRVETTRDVKIGGGLLADVHKGFRLDMVQQRTADGVWLTQHVEGTGDARAALFLHPRFRFREQLDKCHIYSVNTKEAVQPTPGASHETGHDANDTGRR